MHWCTNHSCIPFWIVFETWILVDREKIPTKSIKRRLARNLSLTFTWASFLYPNLCNQIHWQWWDLFLLEPVGGEEHTCSPCSPIVVQCFFLHESPLVWSTKTLFMTYLTNVVSHLSLSLSLSLSKWPWILTLAFSSTL